MAAEGRDLLRRAGQSPVSSELRLGNPPKGLLFGNAKCCFKQALKLSRLAPLLLFIQTGIAAFAVEQPASYRAKKAFLGCWMQRYASGPGRPRGGETTLCFQRGRSVGGISVLFFGEGRDFCERWRVVQNKILIYDFSGNIDKCFFDISKSRSTLELADCRFKGEWHRDDSIDRRGWPCRSHKSEFSKE